MSCYGGSNGAVSVSASGGTAPYAYSWSNGGGTAAAATGLTLGSYVLTVSDANGCSQIQPFDITQPSGML